MSTQFFVESWDPSYGTPSALNELTESVDQVDLDVEVEVDQWEPIDVGENIKPESVVFIDGVRRFDAHLWVGDGLEAKQGICATVAAGAVRCTAEEAKIEVIQIERALHTSAEVTEPVLLPNVSERYTIKPTKDDTPESLNFSVHNHMARIEDAISEQFLDEDLVVYDGPLNQRETPEAVGYVKTQHVQYLEGNALTALSKLKPGERTPLFRVGNRFERFSWFMRLQNPMGPERSGIVRIELPTTYSEDLGQIAERANYVTAVIPTYASAPHREARAPQNLYPIAGLERQMRWRLGDRDILERGLRLASRVDA